MRVNLEQLLLPALSGGYAVPCFNVFGYEDAVAVIRAAEMHDAPVILATNKEMVEFMGPKQLASMLGILADDASVPVCVHLDHCYEEAIAQQAVDAGYSSIMFDGSQLPLQENIDRTASLVDYAHAANVSIEGEIGSVSYSKGREHIAHRLTQPDEAELFSTSTGVDAVAVSIGNVHRLESASSKVDSDLLSSIAERVKQPLVIHGTSGIPDETLSMLAKTRVCKFNIGTRLRQAFGRSLRETLAQNPDEFDRMTIFDNVMPAISDEAAHHLLLLGAAHKSK